MEPIAVGGDEISKGAVLEGVRYLLAEGGVIVRPAGGEGEVCFVGEAAEGLVETPGMIEWQG